MDKAATFGRYCFDQGYLERKESTMKIKEEMTKIGWHRGQDMEISARGGSFGTTGIPIIQN